MEKVLSLYYRWNKNFILAINSGGKISMVFRLTNCVTVETLVSEPYNHLAVSSHCDQLWKFSMHCWLSRDIFITKLSLCTYLLCTIISIHMWGCVLCMWGCALCMWLYDFTSYTCTLFITGSSDGSYVQVDVHRPLGVRVTCRRRTVAIITVSLMMVLIMSVAVPSGRSTRFF